MSFKTKTLYLLSICILAFLAYSNHFDNAFHFDDFHTIKDNSSIRSLKNIPLFFKDATTTSTLPFNQAYRPGLTTLNALDFYLSGENDPMPFMFHVSIFISYLVLGFLCFLLFSHLLKISLTSRYNDIVSLLFTAFFLVHTANAETINYIIARSDSFSTLMIVLSFIMYLYLPRTRKWHLYFLPSLIGFFVKEPSLMFVPLLLVYKLLFEQQLSVNQFLTKQAFRSLKQVLIPLIACILVFVMSRIYTPVHWQGGGTNSLDYLLTQPFVIFHYVMNFILPLNLAVDTDWKPITNYHTDEMFAGLLFVAVLLIIAVRTSKLQKTRPVSFGILWFFLALAPSSSIIPFAEVLNDHRTFFPYIGLFISLACMLRNLLQSSPKLQAGAGKWALIFTSLLVIALHAYGTYNRNKVWATEESLWKDATVKSPESGRVWMNYGNTLMAKGDYTGALQCYEKTVSLSPSYAYAYINIGIAKSQLGDHTNAEINFKKALELEKLVPDCYAFYGQFLVDQGRFPEAVNILQQGLSISPNHVQMLALSQQAMAASQGSAPDDKIKVLLESIQQDPTPEKYLDLSLAYYNNVQYQECIAAANKALLLKPDYELAYNNICAAYNKLQQWDKAIDAAEKGLKINPNNELLKGNLAVAQSGKKK